jgi:predicted PhzF superfamily epimerase YddE/YHI9
MLVYRNKQEIKDIQINRQYFDQINLGCGGVIVTAPGNTYDFVSRYFTPQATILEDPVTGSAHCTLIPFWSTRLSKKNLQTIQLSKRSGELSCRDTSDRVIVGGQATTYSSGEFFI